MKTAIAVMALVGCALAGLTIHAFHTLKDKVGL